MLICRPKWATMFSANADIASEGTATINMNTTAGASQADMHAQYQTHVRAAQAAFPGPRYHDWLLWLHDRLRPRVYCEIGIANGSSLALIRPETRVIGIDPAPLIAEPLPPRTQVFAMPSDDFFVAEHANRVLGEDRFDFGFIDGLHRADQALRDFIHLERFSRPGAVIALHDVLPLCAEVATPVRQTVFWTGDIFKTLLVLTELRPDLRVVVVPCFPSGLALVTGVDPRRAIDMSAYSAAVAAWQPVSFDAAFAEFKRRVPVLPNELAAFARILAELTR